MEKTAGYLALRSQGNRQGVALLLYKVILNVAVFLVLFFACIPGLVRIIFSNVGASPEQLEIQFMQLFADIMEQATGWGYVLALLIALTVGLLWKKPRYFANLFTRRGKAMKPGSFFFILSLFLSGQILYQLGAYFLEWVLSHWDVSILQFLEANAVDTDTLGMFLYVCIGAPIFEELCFRGLILHGLAPFGRKFAIFMSALFFGLFHGSPLQSFYAMLTGLVLGYVALEYHILWAMILHMINNLLLADTLPRLLQGIHYGLGDWLLLGILILFFLAALILTAVRIRPILSTWRKERVRAWQLRAYLLSPGMLSIGIICLLEIGFFVIMLLIS